MTRPLPQPTMGEMADALRVALTSNDATVQELLKTIWLVTRTVHPRPASYWQTLPDLP